MNTSSDGGYLLPTGEALADIALEDILIGYVRQITGLSQEYVRPRWQSVVPKQPERDVNWCAVGIVEEDPDAGPVIERIDDESVRNTRHELVTVLATFYGESAQKYAKRLRDGLGIPQNNDLLKRDGLVFIESMALMNVPELVNEQWVRRYDLSFILRRRCNSTYAIQTIDTTSFDLHKG